MCNISNHLQASILRNLTLFDKSGLRNAATRSEGPSAAIRPFWRCNWGADKYIVCYSPRYAP